MHIWTSLPTDIENGARRSTLWDVEVVSTDGGNEVRNSRWSAPLRQWEISFNNAAIDNANHALVEEIWELTEGGNYTFNWTDERTSGVVAVRFDADLTFTNTVGPYWHLDTFVIKEVRGTPPALTVAPAISGTPTVGQTLTCSAGTWSGTVTISRQWLRNGVEISGATASTYVLQVADAGKLISCYVFATENGETTRTETAEVGPIAP